MTSHRLRPLDPSHGELVEVQAPVNWIDLSSNCYAWTLFDDKEVVSISGVTPRWKGVGEAWLIRFRWERSDIVWTSRCTRHMLGVLEDVYDFHRISCTVAVDFPAAHRWAKMMGFRAEGVLSGYDSEGNDHVQYARLRSCQDLKSSDLSLARRGRLSKVLLPSSSLGAPRTSQIATHGLSDKSLQPKKHDSDATAPGD